MSDYILKELPPDHDVETKSVLKQTLLAHRFLAELKGISKTIPNQNILIYTLPLMEAKDSSAIENIITTHDELYKEDLFSEFINNPSAKEVQKYSLALRQGYQAIKDSGLLTNKHILEIQATIENNRAGFRKLPGTALKNETTGETVYTPPQDPDVIMKLMSNLESFMNDDSQSTIDPLIKMALIHFQFESIHPFYDGNGRTGRILNILYLVHQKLLDIPVLYLSRYIIQNKNQYYKLLQDVRVNNNWEEWILYIIKGIEVTACDTIDRINKIRELTHDYKHRIRNQYKFYSQDLLNNLFCHPYTKIEFLENDLKVTRKTASKYLDELCKGNFLRKEKVGVNHYFINEPLFNIFTQNRS